MTRLQERYQTYQNAVSQLSLSIELEDRVQALRTLYQTKLDYAKQYHGKKFDALYQKLISLQRELYDKNMLYEIHPLKSIMKELLQLHENLYIFKQVLFRNVND